MLQPLAASQLAAALPTLPAGRADPGPAEAPRDPALPSARRDTATFSAEALRLLRDEHRAAAPT